MRKNYKIYSLENGAPGKINEILGCNLYEIKWEDGTVTIEERESFNMVPIQEIIHICYIFLIKHFKLDKKEFSIKMKISTFSILLFCFILIGIIFRGFIE